MHTLRQLSSGRRSLVLLSFLAVIGVACVLASGRRSLSAGPSASPVLGFVADPLQLHRGDHICLIGNTLADRMQHDGWLETYIYSRFPKDDLVIRDLGFSGDEVELSKRSRSAGFGTPDQHLTFNKADVILAFFGYNESFAGPEGLEAFKRNLDEFLKHTLGEKYNGQSAPRVVLFSPIAHENLHDRNLPNGAENNARIKLYTNAMAEVAKANAVLFVDLFDPMLTQYAHASKPLTINGVHLTDDGDRVLAEVIDAALFAPHPALPRDSASVEKLRQAILDKDLIWFNRYRTVDGYSIFGGRADLSFTDGQTNRVVAQREMEVLDVMTANRDKKIWAIAQGGDLTVDDSNTPPFIPVRTNRPGKGPNGEHIFLTPEEEIATMTVHPGMKVTLFASEREFPELSKPVQMEFDPKGRLVVAAWPSYPHWKPKEEMNDKILIFEDTKGAGKADKCTVFADHLHCPTGFEFCDGGVLVAEAPDIMLVRDSTGGDHADTRIRVLDGVDSADTHHTSNSFSLDPGGAVYFQEGTFMHTQVETPWAPTLRNTDAGVYRYEPRTQKFEAYVPFGFANPHGHVWDRWGQDFVFDGTGANPYHGALFSGHLDYPEKHGHPPQLYQQRTRPCPGVEILTSRHFPDELQGNLLVANVIGFQGILQYKFADDGASFHCTEVEPILSSTDENFRPSDLKIGPDGALYFLDWQNPIIGHMQHNLRDPSRDRIHGRIYRVTWEGRPLLKPVKIAGEPIDKLLDVLKEPEDRVRNRARIEIGNRPTDEVIAAVKQWIEGLDPKDADYEHNMMEALWVHQFHNVVNVELLKRMLGSPDFHARAAATRVLCYWRDRVPGALELLKKQAADPHPRVRLEAVRAASFFQTADAMEVGLVAEEYPSDQYLDFVRGETNRAIEPYLKRLIAKGKQPNFTTPSGRKFFLRNVTTDDLVRLRRSPEVYKEILSRPGVREEFRTEAVTGLAKSQKQTEVEVLLAAINEHDHAPGKTDESVIFDLGRMLTSHPAAQLSQSRSELESIAIDGRLPATRQFGFAALVAADGSAGKAWDLALKSARGLRDLVSAVSLIGDPSARVALYPKIEPLLGSLPKEFAGPSGKKAVAGRYVRIELPGKQRTLTLAEVEVISEGRNIARRGKATQINTDFGGEASRAIDGNTGGKYSDGGQSHTRENIANPWWQVDLGGEHPIDSVVVYNRTEDEFGKRLDGFTIKVLDKKKHLVFEKSDLRAPAKSAAIEIGSEAPEESIRHAAMTAITSVPGKESDAFKALAPFVKAKADDADRQAAVQALLRIPERNWPPEAAAPLIENLLAYIRTVPVDDRTSPEALDALQLADSLAGLLPAADARIKRKELRELGVRVIRIATLPDQMSFDKTQIAVEAGKPVEVFFENNDIMPHNLAVLRPGSLTEVGELAETTATQPGALERNYIPSTPKILFASQLLQPRGSQKLKFVAPSASGVYPFVCTYPGHWRRMYGALYVVADLDEYQANPTNYLAAHKLTVQPGDELLNFNRPRTDWKFDDLAQAVREAVAPGGKRNFAQGKLMFTLANCVACHKFGGQGNEVGPNLMTLTKYHNEAQVDPTEVLHDILEPSLRIHPGFETVIVTTNAGKTYQGLMLGGKKEDAEIKIMENPLAKCEPLIIKKTDIEDMDTSKVSMMPKNLLDKLTKEEILDLVAYVVSHADPDAAYFK